MGFPASTTTMFTGAAAEWMELGEVGGEHLRGWIRGLYKRQEIRAGLGQHLHVGVFGVKPTDLRRKPLQAPLPSLPPPKAIRASQLKDTSVFAVLILLRPLRGLALSTTLSWKPCPPLVGIFLLSQKHLPWASYRPFPCQGK